MLIPAVRAFVAACLVVVACCCAGAQVARAQVPQPSLLDLGDAVVTGFSGTLAPDPTQPRPPGKSVADLTFIDPEGPAARIMDVRRPGFVWDGSVFDAPVKRDLPAKLIGQVFGIALDDAPAPNVYLAATSAFGLNIVGRGADGAPERRHAGGPGTGWMRGQFGLDLQGGPGSIYKVDGATGAVTLFAEVMRDGVPNPGPALGNLAYDAAHRQLLVSDLHTGLVHRFSVDGAGEPGPPYDHGTTGRAAAGLAPVPFQAGARPSIASQRFKAEDPATWGFAPPERRVFGLAVHEGRLFYSVRNGSDTQGPQVWSVGLNRDGGFAGDARLELEVPAAPGPYAVTDIVFSQKGAMILAQRAPLVASYDYSAFTAPGTPRVLRYWLEQPDDPATSGPWIPVPEEYAVGFADTYRNANGGADLGYGYGADGALSFAGCEYTLWTTGQKLRYAPALRSRLEPRGPLLVDGLQGAPAGPVLSFNAPPEVSYFIDYDRKADDPRASGHVGGVRVLKAPCAPPAAAYGGPGYPYAPPYVVVSGPTGDAGCPWVPGPGGSCGYVSTDCPWGLGRDGSCGPVIPDCIPGPGRKECGTTDIDLKLEKTAGEVTFDPKTGLWTLTFTLTVTNAGNPFAPGSSIAIHDPVPPGLTFVAATGANWTCLPAPPLSSGSLNCRYNFGGGILATGPLPDQLVVTATVKEPGKYENCAVTGVGPRSGFREITLANNRACAGVEVKRPPVDVAIVKTGQVEAAHRDPPGPTTLTYTLAVTNVGPAFAGANVITVTDVVPAGLTFTAITAPADWSCGPAAPIAAGGTLTCTYTGTGPAAPGDALGAIGITATATRDGKGPWENCADVAIAPSAGTDTNLADNHACVTLKTDFDKVRDPPEVPHLCGVNVIFVVDESGSVATAGATGTVTSALSQAASLFNVNGSQAALIHFSDTAQLVLPMSSATYGNIATGYNPVGGTNWEAGLSQALALLPGPPPGTVVIFITDGEPNAALDASGATYYTDAVTATNEAIGVVNQIYAQGVPVIGIGIGSISTHLNALLGGNVHMAGGGFGGLSATLTAIARDLCPALYLSKSIAPSYVNVHDTPLPDEVTITLTVTNTAGALTNVVIEDNLPPGLTSPSSPNPSAGVVLGDPLTWTIPSLAANSTQTLSFKVKLTPTGPIPTDGSYLCIRNFAQVTAVGSGTVGTVPNNMANAETGPVHEADEASASICLQNYVPPDNPPCTTSTLWVKKTSLSEVCHPSPQGAPDTGAPCKFTVTVTPRCTDFNGQVLLGDGLFSGAAPAGLPIASITSSPPVSCTWTSGSPSVCAVPNLSLPLGQSITFTVTLGAPIAAGTYRNCFLADGQTPVPADYPSAYAGVNPGSGSNGGTWGHCTSFVVAAARSTTACPAGQSYVAGAGCVIAPPHPPPPPPPVACPPGTLPQGRECVRVPACAPPRVLNADGACACPKGTFPQGRECVQVPACAPPRVLNADGACACPSGTFPRGRECVRVPACAPPRAVNADGACACPSGTLRRGRECVRAPVCTPPRVLNAAGACACPPGTLWRGGECVKIEPRKPAPLRCVAPAFPDRTGARCLCPEGFRATGRACVPLARHPVVAPHDREAPGVAPRGTQSGGASGGK